MHDEKLLAMARNVRAGLQHATDYDDEVATIYNALRWAQREAPVTSDYPRKPIEVEVTANGFTWEQVIAALNERVERLTKYRENGAGCSASGFSASHTADVQLRDVTLDQFVDESIAWLERQQKKRA